MRYTRIDPGATSRSIRVPIYKDDGKANTALAHNSAGLAIRYARDNGALTAITLVSLASATAAYTSGGFVHVGSGVYRLDLPDAVLAAGAATVTIVVDEATDIRGTPVYIDLDVASGTRQPSNAGLALIGDAYAADGYVSSAVETFGVDPVAFNRLLALANQYGDDGAIRAILAPSQPNYAPSKAGDAMTLTTGERTSIGTAVWANATRSLTTFGSLINDIWTHATRILTAGTNIVLAKGTGVTGFNDITPTQAASAVRTELTTELGRIDVATSSRMGTFTYVAPPTAADNASAVRVNLATELARIDVAIGTRATAGDLSGLLTTTAATTRFDTIDAAIAAIQAGSLSPEQADQLAAAAKVGPLIVGDAFTSAALANGVGGGGGSNGNGDVPVDHDYGGTDALIVTLPDDSPVDDALVTAKLGNAIVAQTRTGSNGRWVSPLMLDADTYTLVVSKPGVIAHSQTLEVT